MKTRATIRPDQTAQAIDSFATGKLASLQAKQRRRDLYATTRQGGGRAERAGRDLISFCDNDYLGLAHDPRVVAAASKAALDHGAGSGASRLVTGDHPLNHALEDQIARMKGFPAARVFGSGYLANLGTIPVIAGKGDRLLLDELSHSCMHAGAQLSGARIETFKHNDVEDLERLLSEDTPYQKTLVITETIFSMDGDLAPLAALHEVCERYGAWLMTDDAHGLGVVNIDNPAPIQMGTLSKAAGSYGGYVCGPQSLIDLLISRARSFVYTTGLPPAVLAASLEALHIIEETPELGERALSHARRFCARLGLSAPESCIVPIVCGEEARALDWSAKLEAAGFLVTAIRPPTVPNGTARLRVTFSAAHSEADVDALAGEILSLMEVA